MKSKEKIKIINLYADGRKMDIKKAKIPSGHQFYEVYARIAKETILKERGKVESV